MSNEFDYAELYPCDICGEMWPMEEMLELEDGRIICPDCADAIESEQ